jgi:D-alanyl-D-alanine carboxypeptidase/D-alanyl-D-alanine-endopeptidase (penicillin-binding protein 4)
LYAADVFRTFARAQGISLPAGEVTARAPSGQVIVQHQSQPLRIILRDMLKFSTNLTAEVVGMSATAATDGRPADLRSSARAMTRWCRSKLGISAQFVDHSGLGDASRISADQMVKALVAVGPNGPLRAIMKNIMMTDSERREIPNHPVSVQAKTGTLNFVSTLSGYVQAVDGRVLAFAIFGADAEARAAIARDDREVPQGARGWNRRAKRLQQRLLQRWGYLYVGS